MEATVAQPGPRRHLVARLTARLRRAGMLTLMSLATINVYTGSPLMALWIGSRVQGPGPPSMGPIAVVFVTMVGFSYVLVRVLARLGAAYDRLTGRRPAIRQHVPWLRSMRGERPHEQGDSYRLSALDVVLVASVVVAVAAFEVWFFFFSGSPIGATSGRG